MSWNVKKWSNPQNRCGWERFS